MDASNDIFSYLSEPTSPGRCGKEGFFFYSLPATPGFSPSPSPSPSQPVTPCLFGDSYSSFDVFEFETSRRLGLKLVDLEIRPDFDGRIDAEKHQGRRLGIALPEMTFADELFSNGKVLPLLPPLKLPPRLQRDNGYTGCKKSPTASSPRSPISVPKSKFSRNNLFDANFDPFTAALENVRKEDGRKTLEDKSRRANSLPPARTISRQRSDGTLGLKAHKNANMGLHSPLLAPKAIGPRPNILDRSGWANLKGLAIARKFRLAKTEFENNVGPPMEPAKKKKETREPTFFRKLMLKKPIKSEFTKMTRVPWRLRFPLCLGFGSRYDDQREETNPTRRRNLKS